MSAVALLAAACYLLALGSGLCACTVVVQMVMHDEIVLALLSLFCCGAIPFFFGWAKADEWDNVLLMIAWTVCNVCLFFACLMLIRVLPAAVA